MNKELIKITQVMYRMQGLDISSYDDAFLSESVRRRLTVTGVKTAAAYGAYIEENHAEAHIFFRSLNNTYSEFFRDPLTFALLEQAILPGLVLRAEETGRGEIRVWSAGCARGQEAYSLAILLDESIAARGRTVALRIFATDRSPSDLAAARKGAYDEATVQNVRLKHLRSCFFYEDGTYTVSTRIKDLISFSMYDLLREDSDCPPESIYGDFDLVMISNLLFYYRPDIRRSILRRVHRSLATDGYLVTGKAERDLVTRTMGFRARFPSAAVFQKA